MWRSVRNRWYPIISGAATTALLMFLIATTIVQLNATVAALRSTGRIVAGHVQGGIAASAVTVVAPPTAASPGEMREIKAAEICSHAAWPEIPAGCLDGGKGNDVRFVTANRPLVEEAMLMRFAEAFE